MRERFASLDARLDRQDDALEDIYREAKRTNGRVTSLEKTQAVSQATTKQVEEWKRERAEARKARFWRIVEIDAGFLGVLLAALLPLLLTGAI